MRRFSRIAALAATVAVTQLFSSAAIAVDYTWSNLAGGTTAWNVPANWGGAGFPNALGDTGNINVGLTGNLNVTLPSTFTLSGLILGSTGSAVTTDIGAGNTTAGGLIFNNGAVNSPSYIYSRGVAGVSNIISAPLYLSGDNLAPGTLTTLRIGNSDINIDPVADQRSLVLNGPIQPLGGDRTLQNNLVGNGATLTINGPITLSGGLDTENLDPLGRARRINFQGAFKSTTIMNGTINLGTLPAGSVIGATGVLNLGTVSGATATISIADNAVPVFQLNANNSTFDGQVVLNRGRYVLNAPTALGTAEIRGGNPSNAFGFEIVAGSDNYHVANNFRLVQSFTLRGENSIIFDGIVYNTQNRALVNLLPEGETATFTQPFYTGNNTGDTRTSFFDGTGTTLLDGGIRNYYIAATPLDDNAGNGGSIVQRGGGRVIVNGTTSTMRGYAMSSGGLLEFASPGSYGVQADNGAGSPNAGAVAMATNPGGAIGVRTGSLNPDFINLFTRELAAPYGTLNDANLAAVPNRGAIALSTVDANVNINFTAGDLANARVQTVSIGALLGGVTYTGTITPANNTYRLGGGDKLTMANVNALTGANSLEVVNGGTVSLAQANNYTGTTTVQGNWIATSLEHAQNSVGNTGLFSYTIPNPNDPANPIAVTERPMKGVRIDPVLEVAKLDDVTGSSLGNTSAIRLRGGTLRYVGATNSTTNKTLTIGSAGATLDSSGTGVIDFASSSAATLEDQADITSQNDAFTSTLGTGNGGVINFGANDPLMLANVGLGWTVTGPGIPETATIDAIALTSLGNPSNSTTVALYLKNNSTTSLTAQLGAQTYSFSNQIRTLTLSGSNTGNNRIANALGNSAKGTLGINKTGAGKWILAGNNTYSGATTVTAGTLGVGSVNALGATSGTTVKSGATLAIATPSATAVKIDNAKLTRESGSKLDLLRGKLVLDYTGGSPLATVKADIISGYANGAFTGAGITTSDTVGGKKLRVGYAEASQLSLGGTYFGQSVDADAIILAGTYGGDTDLNGTVNFDDLLKLAQNYGGTGKEWVHGDSDYNGNVNFDDLLSLAQNYSAALAVVDVDTFGQTFASDWALALSVVPEPVSLSGIAALGLLAGRRRRD